MNDEIAIEVWMLQITEFVRVYTNIRKSRPDIFSEFLTPDEWCEQFRISQGGE